MSYSLTLDKSPTPRTTAVMSGRLAGVICRESRGGLEDIPWPNAILHFYREGVSTRGVEVIFDGTELRVRLVSFTCREDWELAYDFLAAFAPAPDTVIHGEDGTSAPCNGLAAVFGKIFVHETAAALVAVETSVASGSDEAVISGPVRDVYIGKRMLGELPEGAGVRAKELFARFRRVQFLEKDGYEVQAPVPLSAPGIPSFALWSPDKQQAFERVDALGTTSPTGNLYIPVAALPALAGSAFHWLDEHQFAIDPITDPTLLERARLVAIDPYQAVRKKWWQFWRRDD